MTEKFTWVETYKAISIKLRTFRNKQNELLDLLSYLKSRGIPTISIIDKDEKGQSIPLSEIDPFTFFANFNRGLKTENRIEIIRILIERWNLSCSIPTDFTGIPTVNNQQSWFIAYKAERGKQDVDLLWDLFEQAMDDKINEETYNSVIRLKFIGYNITMGLFWIAPDRYLNLDSTMREFLETQGIVIDDVPDYKEYISYMNQVRNLINKPFYQMSEDAWLQDDNERVTTESVLPSEPSTTRYWLFAPGPGGKYWDEFYSKGIMAIGWDELGDLHQYPSKGDIEKAIRKYYGDNEALKSNDALACFSFCNEIKPGDIVYAKVGTKKIIGKGIVTSDYIFDNKREYYKNVRHVQWQLKGEWIVSEERHFALKTLTEITEYPDFVKYLDSLLGTTASSPATTKESLAEYKSESYWWLNANPKIWNLADSPIGTRQTYTSHNLQGNKRRIYQYFQQVKPGDLLVGYMASPSRQIVALCKVTKGLHDTEEGEVFEFEKIEQFQEPVSLKKLQSIPELENCEPLINNQGSLFRLTPNEYETIRSIIDEQNEINTVLIDRLPNYTVKQCAEATGFSSSRIESWTFAIKRKKQAILYGPPGTGKTFLADNLARHIVGGSDGFVELIQFHPAYSYEEFIQGLRPDTDEKGVLLFERTPGRFLSFCRRAIQLQGPCVLIIDEINRANLSHVFGELMYLLEYRDKAIPLAGGELFSIPSNVLIIGTMNTADRSIALVDFALRRRFAFIELAPEYDILLAYQKKRGLNAHNLVSILRDINTKINDKNFALGISFFMVDNLLDNIEYIWTMEIETYLDEYFYSQREAAESYRWQKIKERIFH